MKRMDILASFYDPLAEFVFGDQIKKATAYFLKHIREKDKVLIIGGGTGWVLEQLQQTNLQVTYIDISEGMILKARKRKFSFQVDFIIGSYTSVPNVKYDVVITPFFLDMFFGRKLDFVIQHLATFLKGDGLWIFTDFIHSNKLHHRVLIKIMYSFFSFFYDINGYNLPDYNSSFNKNNLELLKNKKSHNGLFTSRIYIHNRRRCINKIN